MGQETSNGEETAPVMLSGGFTIQEAGRLKDLLLAHITANKVLTLDLSQVDALDVAGLQLLCSAHRTAQSRGGDIRLASQLPECLEPVMRSAGFARHCNCSLDHNNSCLWNRGEKL